MKLLYVIPRLGGAGGVQRVLLLKAGYLAENFGYNVTILVTNNDPDEILFSVGPGITIKYAEPLKGNFISQLAAYRKLLQKTVAEVRPDIITMCDNGLKSLFMPLFIGKSTPTVFEMHATRRVVENELAKNPVLKQLKIVWPYFFKHLLSGYTRFVALTVAGANEWDLKNKVVLPNPLWFTSKGINTLLNKKVVVLDRHIPEKGYDRLLRIWQNVSEAFPEWELNIYGNPNPDYELQKIAAEMDVRQVNFYDAVKDTEKVYSEAAIGVTASYYESFGMVIIEAMECGVPFVAFDVPVGPGSIIKNDVNGFLVPDEDDKLFAENLKQLIQSHDLRLKMGQAAKQTASSYNLALIMHDWDKLFRSLL